MNAHSWNLFLRLEWTWQLDILQKRLSVRAHSFFQYANTQVHTDAKDTEVKQVFFQRDFPWLFINIPEQHEHNLNGSFYW